MRCSRTNPNGRRFVTNLSQGQDHQKDLIPTEEPGDEGVNGSTRSDGRKATKRRAKEKANDIVVELVTSHFKDFGTISSDLSKMFKDLVTVAGKKQQQQRMSFA